MILSVGVEFEKPPPKSQENKAPDVNPVAVNLIEDGTHPLVISAVKFSDVHCPNKLNLTTIKNNNMTSFFLKY